MSQPQARRVLRSYLHANGFGRWAKTMYQQFLTVHVPHCIQNQGPIVAMDEPSRTKHTVTFTNVRFAPPAVDGHAADPYMCKVNRRTYAVPVIVDVSYTREPLTPAEHTQLLAIIAKRTHSTRSTRATQTAQATQETVHETAVYRDVRLDEIPLMVNSDFCAFQTSLLPETCAADQLDIGGYFVHEGAEKIVVGQEVMQSNYPMVYAKDDTLVCEVRSNCDNRLRSSSTFYLQLVPAIPFARLDSVVARVNAGCRINFCLPYCKYLPLVMLFIVLDVPHIKDMLALICDSTDPPWFQHAVGNALMHSLTVLTTPKTEIMARIKADRAYADDDAINRDITNLLNKEFLPHQGLTPDALPAKTVLLGMYARRILRVFFGLQPQDDREHYKHRRNISMFLMSMLFRDSYVQWCRMLQKRMRDALGASKEQPVLDVVNLLASSSSASRKLRAAIRNGDFSIRQTHKAGVANAGQQLSRIEPFAHMGQLLRTNAHGESVRARMLHGSHIGIIDPHDTPDGASVGQTRNMAAFAGVRAGYPTDDLCATIAALINIEPLHSTNTLHPTNILDTSSEKGPIILSNNTRQQRQQRQNLALVSVNGRLIGRVRDPHAARAQLLRFRTARDLPADLGIYVDTGDTLTIDGDMGAFYWPLLRVDRLHLLANILETTPTHALWNTLLDQGVAELMTKAEEDAHVRVAFYARDIRPGVTTHTIIDAAQLASIYSNKGINNEMNQGPRVSYAAGMRKQTAGRMPTVPPVDTCLNVLDYPQRQLVSNTFDTVLNELSGSVQVCHVAVLCSPYNIEDALLVNRAAIDRGWGQVTQYHTVTEHCTARDNEVEQFGLPPAGNTIGRVVGCFDKIDPLTGCVAPGAFVTRKDILVARYAQVGVRQTDKGARVVTYCDRSVLSKHAGQVDRVHQFVTAQGQPAVSITLRTLKRVEVGDKVASQHAQKTSISRIVPPEDMPFMPDGTPVDIMINPHAMPSRMTIGHLLEMLQMHVAAITGAFIDAGPGATSAPYIDVDDNRAVVIEDLMHRLGMLRAGSNLGEQTTKQKIQSNGKTRLMLGTTGERVECDVYASNMSYLRLKHMVNDKYHARSRGPTDPKTRQPVDGRQREGGLRVGEMERDCLLAHGAAHALKDRLCDSSDATVIDVCTRCGNVTNGGERLDGVHSLCRVCVSYTGVSVTMPYAVRLNQAELHAFGVKLDLKVKEA